MQDLPDALEQLNPQLLFCVSRRGIRTARIVAEMRDRTTPDVPLLVIRPQVTEEIMAADLVAGARDTRQLAQPDARPCA